ncbi:ferric reductase like transmembrane component-domain-containing protein [Aspergillus falconensis]
MDHMKMTRHSSMDMDMDSHSGLPWLDSPVMLHSSRADTCKLTPEQCAYRRGHWRYWYEADHVYALNTVYFLCATVFVFAVAHFASRYAPPRARRSPLWQKGTAAGRFLSYRGFRIPGVGYWAGSAGVAGLIGAGIVFFFAMTLGPKPYYWPNTDTVNFGGSPPIATRAGWMAVALLPFVLALGAKANLVSALTGVPHERLQIFHHWTSYAMFVLALVHTFPFIVYNISKGQMVSEWKSSVVYWTGVVALVAQAYLTFMSLPSIRNRYYEFFKATHFLIALLFILFFFFHCDFRLSSWDYFVAAGSLYIFSLLTALIRTHLVNGRHTATLTLLPCGLLQIRIPTILSWKPGQHVFIRFTAPQSVGHHSLTSHPFTICSTAHDIQSRKRANEMVFYVKPKKGITGRLAKLACKKPGFTQTVLLEGPYGGIEPSVMKCSESVLIISGGSGGGFSLGILEAALKTSTQPDCGCGNEKDRRKRSIQVVFACQRPDIAAWYRDEIESLLGLYGAKRSSFDFDINVSIHVTSSSPSPSLRKDTDTDIENTLKPDQLPPSGPAETTTTTESKTASTAEDAINPVMSTSSSSSTSEKTPITTTCIPRTFGQGRPPLPSIIASTTDTGKRIAIYACGPASMLHDVRNAAAAAQEGILRGNLKTGGEVYLHSESFS